MFNKKGYAWMTMVMIIVSIIIVALVILFFLTIGKSFGQIPFGI